MLPRAKKDEKYTEASIVSRYIQNIEDKYVMKMIKELRSRKINVVSYIYDGFMCERDDIITDDYLDECVKAIGLPVSFIIKEQRITWEPEIDENEMYCPRKASQYIIASEGKVQKLADNVFIDEAIWYRYVRYCNKYFAYVKKTNMFLFRETVDQPYEILDKKTFLSRTSKSFTLTPTFIGSRWFESGFNSTIKTYTSIEYIVNKKLAQSDKYRNCLNVYVEPEYKPVDHTKVEFKKMFPRVYGYLSFLASGDKQHTEFLIDWIAGACYTGKNCVALGFMGIEGTGKSTFVNMLLSQLLPDGGVLTTSEPDKFVFGNFNGHIQNKHVIQIDECGDKYAHTQSYANKLKTGITSEEMLIHNKFQTPVMCNSNINLVSSSNDMNIYRMNENSRRFVVYNVSKKHRGDFEYFGKLNKEIKSRVLELRGYLRSLAIDRDIEYVHKVAQGLPRTEAMNDLIDLNMPHDKIYCRDELHVHIKKNRGTLKFDDAYALYKMSYENTGRSTKPLPKNYFSKAIKKEGYTVVRQWSSDDGKRINYVHMPDDTSHLNIPEGPGEHIPDGPTQETRRRNDQYWNEHS